MPTPTAVKPSVVVAPAPTKSAAPAPAALASTHVVAALPAGAALGAKPAAPAFSGGSFALNAAVNKAAASMSSKAAAQPVVSKQDDSDVKAMIEKRKHDVEEQRRKKEEEESARRVALASEAQAQVYLLHRDSCLSDDASQICIHFVDRLMRHWPSRQRHCSDVTRPRPRSSPSTTPSSRC
jgi:hypothetical protein